MILGCAMAYMDHPLGPPLCVTILFIYLVGIDCTIMEESGKVCGYRERKRGKEKADGGPGGRSGGGWQPLHLR